MDFLFLKISRDFEPPYFEEGDTLELRFKYKDLSYVINSNQDDYFKDFVYFFNGLISRYISENIYDFYINGEELFRSEYSYFVSLICDASNTHFNRNEIVYDAIFFSRLFHSVLTEKKFENEETIKEKVETIMRTLDIWGSRFMCVNNLNYDDMTAFRIAVEAIKECPFMFVSLSFNTLPIQRKISFYNFLKEYSVNQGGVIIIETPRIAINQRLLKIIDEVTVYDGYRMLGPYPISDVGNLLSDKNFCHPYKITLVECLNSLNNHQQDHIQQDIQAIILQTLQSKQEGIIRDTTVNHAAIHEKTHRNKNTKKLQKSRFSKLAELFVEVKLLSRRNPGTISTLGHTYLSKFGYRLMYKFVATIYIFYFACIPYCVPSSNKNRFFDTEIYFKHNIKLIMCFIWVFIFLLIFYPITCIPMIEFNEQKKEVKKTIRFDLLQSTYSLLSYIIYDTLILFFMDLCGLFVCFCVFLPLIGNQFYPTKVFVPIALHKIFIQPAYHFIVTCVFFKTNRCNDIVRKVIYNSYIVALVFHLLYYAAYRINSDFFTGAVRVLSILLVFLPNVLLYFITLSIIINFSLKDISPQFSEEGSKLFLYSLHTVFIRYQFKLFIFFGCTLTILGLGCYYYIIIKQLHMIYKKNTMNI